MTKKLNLSGDKPKPTRKPRVKKTVTAKAESLKVGDAVEKITKATGIKKVVEIFSQITGADCGCEERKEKLNDIFRRRRLKARCITQDEYYQLTQLTDIKRSRMTREHATKVAKIYSSIFSTRYEFWCDTCPQIWLAKIQDLKDVQELYRKEMGDE